MKSSKKLFSRDIVFPPFRKNIIGPCSQNLCLVGNAWHPSSNQSHFISLHHIDTKSISDWYRDFAKVAFYSSINGLVSDPSRRRFVAHCVVAPFHLPHVSEYFEKFPFADVDTKESERYINGDVCGTLWPTWSENPLRPLKAIPWKLLLSLRNWSRWWVVCAKRSLALKQVGGLSL